MLGLESLEGEFVVKVKRVLDPPLQRLLDTANRSLADKSNAIEQFAELLKWLSWLELPLI